MPDLELPIGKKLILKNFNPIIISIDKTRKISKESLLNTILPEQCRSDKQNILEAKPIFQHSFLKYSIY